MKLLTASLAAALLFGVAPLASAGERDDDSAAEILRAAETLFERSPAQSTGSSGRAGDATLSLRRLRAVLPSLDRSQRRRAERILLRPDKRGDSDFFGAEADASPLCDANFCVHWSGARRAAPDSEDLDGDGIPDFVNRVAATAAITHRVQHGELGWQRLRSDGNKGSRNGAGRQGQSDIYLVNLAPGLFGYAADDLSSTGSKRSGYLVLDRDYEGFDGDPTALMQATLAHEYNHVLQFGYDAFAEDWLFESSATWMEEKVFPEVNDYLAFVESFARNPMTSLAERTKRGGPVKIYGSAMWHHWLDSGISPSVVRESWEETSRAGRTRYAVDAMDRAIRGLGGSGFAPEFFGFAVATAEWQGSARFPDRELLPDVRRKRVGGRKRGKLRLDHTSYGLFNVKPKPGAGVEIVGRLEQGTSGGFALVGREGPKGSPVVADATYLPKGGRTVVGLPDPTRFDRITAVAVNSDIDTKRRGYRSDDARVRIKVRKAR